MSSKTNTAEVLPKSHHSERERETWVHRERERVRERKREKERESLTCGDELLNLSVRPLGMQLYV